LFGLIFFIFVVDYLFLCLSCKPALNRLFFVRYYVKKSIKASLAALTWEAVGRDICSKDIYAGKGLEEEQSYSINNGLEEVLI